MRVLCFFAGGIEPLLALLESGTQKAKENSIAAISMLAESDSIQRRIVQSGGITLLAAVLATSSNIKELMAYPQLYSLAASALTKLAKGNAEHQAKITEAGGIPSLVSCMSAPLPELQANAAACLGNLAEGNFDNQAAIARTGAVAPLCTLVREGADMVKEQAAGALWSLTIDNKPNKDTVTKLGGIEPLVSLIVNGTTENSLKQAMGALASLCAKHVENRETIAKLIVNRMANRTQLAQTDNGPERVLSAVSMMCNGSSANQAAIAKAGGVPPLILWLSGGGGAAGGDGAKSSTEGTAALQGAQAAAATALLSMVAGNEMLQVRAAPPHSLANPRPALRSPCNGASPRMPYHDPGLAPLPVMRARALVHAQIPPVVRARAPCTDACAGDGARNLRRP